MDLWGFRLSSAGGGCTGRRPAAAGSCRAPQCYQSRHGSAAIDCGANTAVLERGIPSRAAPRAAASSCRPKPCPPSPGAAGMLLPYGKAYPGASRGAGDAACWECFESLLLAHTPGMLSGSCGSSSASLGSDIHLGPLLLGSQCKNQGGSTMGSPEVPTGLPRGFLHPMPFPSLLPGFSQLPGGGRLYPV